MINWKDVKEKPKEVGWYLAAVNPNNHDPENPKESNRWREDFGCSKAFYNPCSGWYEPDISGYGSKEITKRVTHWAELPKVPLY